MSEADVCGALTAQKLFEGCDPELLQRLAEEAFTWTPGRGHEIPMRDEMPLMVVMSGALYVCIGGGPAANASTGFAIGFVGMMRLHEVAEATSRTSLKGSIFDVTEALEAVEVAEAEGEDSPRDHVDHGFTLPDESEYSKQMVQDCIQNLCPHSLPSSKGWQEKSSVLRMEVVDALTNQRNFLQTDDEENGICKLACISLERIYDVLDETPSLETFERNRAAITHVFETFIRLSAFPSAPLEVIWMLASLSEVKTYQKGEAIVTEGDCGAIESFIILSKGSANVEKMMFDSALLEAQPFRIARLQPGAIIGDICFIESWISCPATVSASEEAEVISVPSRSLLHVMASYPGLTSIYVSRLRETSAVLQKSLTRPADVLAGMKLFHGLNPLFIRALANITERKMNFLGDVFKEEGSTDRTLRYQEFGKVRVETQLQGYVGMTDVGTVNGEHMFLGMRSVSQATFRAATPILVMLWIPHHSFENVISDGYPFEGAYFRSLQKTDHGMEDMSHYATDLKLFRGCGYGFIQEIGTCIHRRAYKPAQTIVVQAAIDDRSLFLVKTGKASVIMNGKVIEEYTSGGVFGELTLLGLVLLRTASVVAASFCCCLEMPRKAFLEALDNHPEETDHFEQLTRLHAVQAAAEQGTWPFLAKVSERLLYYFNLHATRESTPPGEWASRDGHPLPTDMAYLLVSGEVYVTEDSGHRILVSEGQCFGEHVLIGLDAGITLIEPRTACELQILSRPVFEKVLAECPDERDVTVQGILDEMAIKSQEKLGVLRGSPDILMKSALFRAARREFRLLLRDRMYAMLFQAGECITRERGYADLMFILVRGSAVVTNNDGPVLDFQEGDVISEASLLGTCTFYPYVVHAENLCLLVALPRPDFKEILDSFPEERALFTRLEADEQDILRRLPRVLKMGHPLFAASSIDFLKASCEFADEVYYAAGEQIIKCGESCSLGNTVMYLLVAGNVSIILAHGEEVAQIKSGSLVGEGGALGIANKRSTHVCAWKAGMVRLIRLHGPSIGKAVEKHPDDCKAIELQFQQRSQKNAEAEAIRKEWIKNSVMRHLKNCQIFNGFSTKLISKIAGPLLKITFPPGKDLCVAGDKSESMIVIVDGEVEAKCKAGKVVAKLHTGAVTGELAVLGLLSFRTATFTACRSTDTVVVTSAALRAAMQSSDAATKHLQQLAEEKLAQIERGFPILSLPLGATNDVVVRTISLHSVRFILAPGEAWTIPVTAAASGRHHWIFARGRAVVLVGPSDHPMNPIQTVGAGTMAILPEWLCMQYEARAVALTPVEAFRLSCMDIQLATLSVRSIPTWFQRFRGLERDAIKNFHDKLFRAKAVLDMTKVKEHVLKPLKKSRSNTRLKVVGLNVEEEGVAMPSTPRNPFSSEKRPASSTGALLSTYPSRGGDAHSKSGFRLRPLSATSKSSK